MAVTLWQTIPKYLFRVFGQTVGEFDVEVDDEVSPFGGVLRVGQSVTGDPTPGRGLHNVVDAQGYYLSGKSGDIHLATTQCLTQ